MADGTSDPPIGFIFDLDGTILDDIHLGREIPEELAKYYGVKLDKDKEEIAAKKILEMMSGESSKWLVIKIIFFIAKMYGIPFYKRLGYLIRAIKLYRKRVGELDVFPGTEELFKKLLSMGYKIGINTTSSKNEIKTRMSHLTHIIEIIGRDNIISRNDVKKMKPDPEGILKLADKWGIPVCATVMIGDMPNDIIAGKRAGSVTVGVLSGFADRSLMKKLGPDFIIETIADIGTVLDRIIRKVGENCGAVTREKASSSH